MTRELNWDDCRDAATDAAANLAHCFATVAGDLTGLDRDMWIEEQTKRAMRVGLRRGIENFNNEKDEPTNVTGYPFA